MLKFLVSQVSTSTGESLASRQQLADVMERELQVVSPSTRLHLEQVRYELSDVLMLIWISQHVINELYAGVANLKAVKKHCSSSRFS